MIKEVSGILMRSGLNDGIAASAILVLTIASVSTRLVFPSGAPPSVLDVLSIHFIQACKPIFCCSGVEI